MTADDTRHELVAYGRSLFARGYSCGTSGNLSARLEDGSFLMTPTNVSLGRLEDGQLSELNREGRHVGGPPPTKEAWLHFAMYAGRPRDTAVVHVHSTHAVALSCRKDRDDHDALPALTPYVVMRVGQVAIVPYRRPGDAALAATVTELSRRHYSLLLANHGPVVSGPTLAGAVATAEELEETARLLFILEGRPYRTLEPEQIQELQQMFGR
jgi:ribulose-5-phosphate 4-epimerase/fuculose-1-phosphate aldolase